MYKMSRIETGRLLHFVIDILHNDVIVTNANLHRKRP